MDFKVNINTFSNKHNVMEALGAQAEKALEECLKLGKDVYDAGILSVDEVY